MRECLVWNGGKLGSSAGLGVGTLRRNGLAGLLLDSDSQKDRFKVG